MRAEPGHIRRRFRRKSRSCPGRGFAMGNSLPPSLSAAFPAFHGEPAFGDRFGSEWVDLGFWAEDLAALDGACNGEGISSDTARRCGASRVRKRNLDNLNLVMADGKIDFPARGAQLDRLVFLFH